MNKILLVAKRELLTRIRKKTFLLSTILLPLIIFGFYGLMIYFSVKGDEGLDVAVADKSDIFQGKLESKNDVQFKFMNNESEKSLREKLNNKSIDAFVYIPEGIDVQNLDTLRIVSSKKVGLASRERIERIINNKLEENRLMALNISKSALDSVQNRENHFVFSTLEGTEDDDGNVGISYAVGFFSGFLIYIILFIYGTMVMRGVMEEKVSRIAEVIVSSVKPFQLMMGKILGIGAVGLIQFLIWIVLILGLQTVLVLMFPTIDAAQVQAQAGGMGMNAASNSGAVAAVSEISKNIATINFPLILGCFIFYFLGGYLLYSSLFAAVGSSVNEDPQDAQSLLLPITMPIIFGIVILTKAVNAPYSTLSVFGSLFPLTSPIVMMARVAHGIPDGVSLWELLLSMLLLVAGFILTTWLAGKIYRTGILMYGKKPTWKELWKWAFAKK